MTSLLSAVAACAFPLAASAQLYAAAAAGAARNDVACHDRLTRCEKVDIGFKLLAGYRFTPLVAGEVTYFDFGQATLGDPFFTQDLIVTALGLGVALHGDFTPSWSWVGRAGLARVRVGMEAIAGPLRGTPSDAHVAPYFGAGVSYRFSKQLSLDLSADFTESEFSRGNNSLKWDTSALWLGITLSR
jgi:hypothetical protein